MSAQLALLVAGGLVAGGAHVITGPDHLAAVLPLAASAPKRAIKVGAQWGLGHGIGVAVLAVIGHFVRESIDFEAVSYWAELAVGVLLIYLGVRTLRQSRVLRIHSHAHDHDHGSHSHPHVHVGDTVHDKSHTPSRTHRRHTHSALMFGVMHGFAGTAHLLGVLPAVAVETRQAVAYLAAYLVGAVIAMAVFAATTRIFLRSEKRLPLALRLTGGVAIVIGLAWVGTTVMG